MDDADEAGAGLAARQQLTRLQNKAEALQNKVAVARSCEASTDKEQWIDKLFERNGALAHR